MAARFFRFPHLTLRSHLLALVLTALLPMIVLGVVFIGWLAAEQTSRVEQGLTETARALSLTLDRELKSSEAVLEALAATPELARDDLAAFRERTVTTLTQYPHWVNIALLDASGRQIVNTARPAGAPLPDASGYDFVRQQMRTAQPVISNLIQGPTVGIPVIVVMVPMLRDGELRYMVSAAIGTQTLTSILEQFGSADEAFIVAVDGNNKVIGRSRNAARYIGRGAPGWYGAAVTTLGGPAIYRGQTVDGVDAIAAVAPLFMADWTLAVVIPASALDVPFWRTVGLAAGAGGGFLTLSLLLAIASARRVSGEVAGLAEIGRRLALRQPIGAPHVSTIEEIASLRGVLVQAARDLSCSAADREQALRERAQAQDVARREAERAAQAKSRFLAAASHDLRQPLQALRLFLEVLNGNPPAERRTLLLGRAAEALTAAEELLVSLLDMSKLEAGIVQPSVRPIPVGPLLEQISRELQPIALQAGLRLRVVPSSAVVASDPVLLGRIVRNLLHNAIRYTRSGKILLGCRREQGRVRIEVWDTGVGIDSQHLPHLFEEFYQVGNAERDRSQGLGLGLSVVKRGAELMGHEIGLSSVRGKGSRFFVRVPLVTGRREQRQTTGVI